MSAKYTAVLNDLLRDEKTKGLINDALSHYPMYTPTSKNEYIPRVVPTREELNQKILNHYKYREIGFETVGRFIDELDIAMCEIMPYYNQLMFTQDQDFNIIYNVDYKKTIDTVKDGEKSENVSGETTSKGESESNNKSETNLESNDNSSIISSVNNTSKNVQSETPQNELSITAENIDGVPYADKVSWNKDVNADNSTTKGSSNSMNNTSGESKSSAENSSEISTETKGTTKDVENTVETTKGNFGVVSAQDLISKYRDIIINIEKMIINDERLKELFMLVY